MTEVKLYKDFKKNLPIELDTKRIENMVCKGFPDVYLRHVKGKNFWLENKIANPNEKIIFEDGQIDFLYQHTKEFSGYALFLISTREVFPKYYLINCNNMNKNLFFDLMKESKTPEQLLELSNKSDEKFIDKHDNIKSVIKFIMSLCS
jgi:uncharacterized protein YlzI (FlbEa/FlbD family)